MKIYHCVLLLFAFGFLVTRVTNAALFSRSEYNSCCGSVGCKSSEDNLFCGNNRYDRFSGQSCCGGVLYDYASDEGCCGNNVEGTLYDSSTKTCCGGVVYDKSPLSCCGSSLYDDKVDKCVCGQTVRPKNDHDFDCCYSPATRTKSYNFKTQTCCTYNDNEGGYSAVYDTQKGSRTKKIHSSVQPIAHAVKTKQAGNAVAVSISTRPSKVARNVTMMNLTVMTILSMVSSLFIESTVVTITKTNSDTHCGDKTWDPWTQVCCSKKGPVSGFSPSQKKIEQWFRDIQLK